MHTSISLPDLSAVRLLVYGDVMLDRYWYGRVSRVSPEAPVPVALLEETRECPGGAANVAFNAAQLGVSTVLYGLIGDDAEGRALKNLLTSHAVKYCLPSYPHYQTATKLRILGQNQQLLRVDSEKRFQVVDDSSLYLQYREQLEQADVVVFSDYAKGTLRNVKKLIRWARDKGVLVLVDPKSHDFSQYAGATLVTPNRREFEAVVGPCDSKAMLQEKAVALLKEQAFGGLLVTLGKDGLMLVEPGCEPCYLSAQAREVYDVTGAGDTLVAVLGAAMAAGQSMREAARLANLAAGLVVAKLGTATVELAELRCALSMPSDAASGVLSQKSFLTALSEARALGEKIVMTNGCFDILHAGHIRYLNEARALGDRLVVAVNDDASVRRLKGSSRPINALQDRMAVLASLKAVDWVFSFSEDTPLNAIKAVAPDVLVKGGDYHAKEIVGAKFVTAKGGEVRVLEWMPGRSTTQLVRKIKAIEEKT